MYLETVSWCVLDELPGYVFCTFSVLLWNLRVALPITIIHVSIEPRWSRVGHAGRSDETYKMTL